MLADEIKSASSSIECCRLLSIWAQGGSSSLGRYSKLAAAAVSPNSSASSSLSGLPDVLPLPFPAVVDALADLVSSHFPDFAADADYPALFSGAG